MNKKYYIKQGRLRYWAHVLAFGWNKKIEDASILNKKISLIVFGLNEHEGIHC